MIIYEDIKSKISDYSTNGEWGKILDLIGCKDFINDDIDNKLKESLYYYYSNIAESMIGINKPEYFIKYYDLFNKAKNLAFHIVSKDSRNYLIILRSIAYFYKTIYESRLWSTKNLNSYSQDIREKLKSNGYDSLFFRDSALYYYYLSLKRDSDDIKTNYRFATLLREITTNVLQSKDKKAKYIDYSERFKNRIPKSALDQYILFLNKNKIGIMHNYPRIDVDIRYYDNTIKLWEECTNQKEKDRTKAEYLKSLYAYCRHYVKSMDNINITLAGLKYSLINDCSEIVNKKIRYNNQREVLSKAVLVNNKLNIIFRMLDFPSTISGISNPRFIEGKTPIQINFFYYILAKYYISYGVNRGSSKKGEDLMTALKASYFSSLTNYYMSTVKNRTKAVNKWPYILFVKILEELNLSREIDIFEKKFVKIGYNNIRYLNAIREIATLFHEGKYSESKAAGINFIKNTKMSYSDRQIIQRMIERADAFINNPDLIQENRDIKTKHILAKNTLKAIGFYNQL